MTTMEMTLQKLARQRAKQADKNLSDANKREGNMPVVRKPKDDSEGVEFGALEMAPTEQYPSHAGKGADLAYNSDAEKERRGSVSRAGQAATSVRLDDEDIEISLRRRGSDEMDSKRRSKKFNRVRAIMKEEDEE